MSSTFSRVGGRLAAAGHAEGWELVRWSGHGLHPFHPHAPPERLVESIIRISRRAASATCCWTLNSNWTVSGNMWRGRGKQLTLTQVYSAARANLRLERDAVALSSSKYTYIGISQISSSKRRCLI